jgi:hypothetical protein
MKVFTAKLDDRMDKTLEDLHVQLGKTRAEVFRYALAVLKAVLPVRAQGLRLVVTDEEGKVLKEIVLP